MRPAKISDEKVFQGLSDVFRRKGYDGASYSDLMKATGLVKASLYHRFPGGKADMVDAMLSKVDQRFADHVLKPASEEGRPQDRVRKIARRLREFYDSGKRWCLLDTLTLADSPSTLAHARRSMEFWIDVFARLSRDAGLRDRKSTRLNSSHLVISYAVFCLKKKNNLATAEMSHFAR